MKRTRLPIIALASSLVLAGCSNLGNLTSVTDDPCQTLQSVVADYSSGFESYRGSGSSYRLVTIYRAKEELVRGHCEIWAWGDKESAYTCTVGTPNREVSQIRFAQAEEKMTRCLGTAWSTETAIRERDGKPAGEVVRFRNSGGNSPIVSLHRVDDSNRQSVYLYIGSAGRETE
ncbi:MAG TPA: hypothetical protein VFN01_08115 [Marinobacter sp.]|uniref:hypothetical protein n=1 Tax=Marinobacter sp. TaxID=50741 RepID=UPI0026331910|nr:hypothetical protein [Marinobacter sp.]HET8801134.1 hypothetical protein [Marinobacter sp.]